jgi:hypothetical protein
MQRVKLHQTSELLQSESRGRSYPSIPLLN